MENRREKLIKNVLDLSINCGKVNENANETIIDLGTSIYTFNITELEDYSSTYETKTEYEDIDKNNNYGKTELIENVKISNFNIEKENPSALRRMDNVYCSDFKKSIRSVILIPSYLRYC